MRAKNPKQKKTPPDSKSNIRRIVHPAHYDAYMIAGLLSFPLVAFIISPFIHELFHLLVLKYYSCTYWAVFDLSPACGLYATINHTCTLGINHLVIFYLAGVIGTFLIGFALLLIDWFLTKKDYLEYSVFTSFIALGFLFSPVTYFFSREGDLVNAFSVLDVTYPDYFLSLIGFCLMSVMILYFWFNLRYTSFKELLIEEKEELDRFGVKKTKKEERKKYMPK